jgi:ferrous iron transport protein B
MPSLHLALAGNPNCGKSSLFNRLTGLKQRTGNFPGVTVERISGKTRIGHFDVEVTDLPGTYSLHPLSDDEHVVLRTLLDQDPTARPDAILYVADSTQLERHLLLYTQIRDLGYPVFLALSMSDLAEEKGIEIDLQRLEKSLGHPVLKYNVRDQEEVGKLEVELESFLNKLTKGQTIYSLTKEEEALTREWLVHETPYGRLSYLHHGPNFVSDQGILQEVKERRESSSYDDLSWQVEETLSRYRWIEDLLGRVYKNDEDYLETSSYKADRWLTHPLLGPAVFLFIMFLIYQAIFTLAEWPMNGIDWIFASLSSGLSASLPDHWLSTLLTEGILPGIGGIVIFIPQIALLFFLLGVLEESGYMSRAVFLFDRFFRRFGLNGRSLVALVSASACAIPAVMSARSIKDNKERLITILVTPLVSCSARTPVYIMLIAFIVSSEKMWGWVNPQGLVYMGFYITGLLAALGLAFVLKLVFKQEHEGYLMLEMPQYKWPSFRDVLMHTWHKVYSFIAEAGKIIFIISIVLWFLASFGPGDRHSIIEQEVSAMEASGASEEEIDQYVSSQELETSYAGILGKQIEPVIRPLGFDWKIGIALITSFAAREVFVSTMATIYSVGSDEDYVGIREKMKRERRPETGQPVYTMATALSLVVFYIFALQCMSTLAVVRKETGSMKWPIFQFVLFGAMAYAASFLVYTFMS